VIPHQIILEAMHLRPEVFLKEICSNFVELDSSSDSLPSPRIEPLRKVQFDPISSSPASNNSAFVTPVKPPIPALNLGSTSHSHSEAITPRTKRRLSRPPTELTVAPNVVELKQEEYKRNSMPLDEKSKPENAPPSVTKTFVELSTVDATDPVVFDARGAEITEFCCNEYPGTFRVRSDSPVPLKLNFSKSDLEEPSDLKELVSQMSQVLSRYENSLSNHEEGIDKRIQHEIARREEAERKLGEKLEELHIFKIEKEIREASERKQTEAPLLEALLEKEIAKRQELERELKYFHSFIFCNLQIDLKLRKMKE
jgi:hypothetical protein